MSRKLYDFQLKDSVTGEIIQSSGGLAYIAENGDTSKQTLYNEDGTSLANPVTLTRGRLTFWVDGDTNKVDIYGMAPGGQAFQLVDVKPSGPNEISIDAGRKVQVLVIPFSIDDTSAATETDTGFDMPTNALVLSEGLSVLTTTLDATEDIDVGLLSGEVGGDADGFMNGVSVATAVLTPAKTTATTGSIETYLSATTRGALVEDFLAGADTAGDVGTSNPKPHRIDGTAKSVSYTLAAGSDTAEGFINLPYILA